MIEFKNVSLSFGSHTIFEDLNFKANFHERVAVIGGSGSGKTTILRLVLGLTRPDDGDILIDGRSITDLPESQLRPFRMKFNIVFQEGALFDSMPVRENVAFCLREFSRLTETQIEQKVRTLLESLGIEEAIDLMPEELSGGMRRRVAIARSLAECEPKMFLFKWKNFKVAILLTGAILIVVFAAIFATEVDKLFAGETATIYAIFDNVRGLNSGAPIRFAGLQIGSIGSIQIRADGKIKVALSLDRDKLTFLKRDATAEILTLGLLGDKYISLTSGSKDDSLKDGDAIPGEIPAELQEIVATT